MTSSLVGSEMCIRDRGRRAVQEDRKKTRAKRQRAWTLALEASQWDLTVSYTHLTLPTICSV
eukprot:4564241-Prorocentrum_lima.AAC.1